MPTPIRPESFSLGSVSDWTGGLTSFVMNGSGLDCVIASSACKPVPVAPESQSSFSQCRMTDVLNSSLAPSSDSEFLKMRVSKEYISRLIDTSGEDGFVAEVEDCMVMLNIIGAPGTYAVRLKNENDVAFSDWIAVGQKAAITNNNLASAFRPIFVAKDEFLVPWVLSPSSGEKQVFAEVLTFFGRSETMALNVLANYRPPSYSASIKVKISGGGGNDETSEIDPPRFNGYPVISSQVLMMPSGKAATPDDIDALEVGEEKEIEKVVVRFKFSQPDRVKRLIQLGSIGALGSASDNDKIMAHMVTRGVKKFSSIMSAEDADAGVYKAEFEPLISDGVLASDGIAAFYPSVPNECVNISLTGFDLVAEGIDFAGLGDNIKTEDDSSLPSYRGFSDPKDRKNAFGDASYWRKA